MPATGQVMVVRRFANTNQSPNLYDSREYLRGKYHCTIDILFDWFGLVCFANKNKKCQLSYSWFQTSQKGGQQYSDTSPFSIPWLQLRSSFRSVNRFKSKIKILLCPVTSGKWSGPWWRSVRLRRQIVVRWRRDRPGSNVIKTFSFVTVDEAK